MDIFVKLFSGIGTFFIEDPKIAIARFLLIVLGFILAWMGFGNAANLLI
ncbi:hypothetical protein [Klebsiella pneumoniae]|nr:hypothetical protein [Klebsiella pneumoniae]MBW2955026.1 hypothetical protein [Klebsiella pneumoniae]QWS96197.1 hypothetical protein FOH49_004335 [Klebsiella pneumoniae]QWT01267.1 hypothetical protein FOH48_004310 [Klebsiella pneumoniae]QWT06328.1 hypothetical protein FOH51_004310 [Klebsiella pneumoniae]